MLKAVISERTIDVTYARERFDPSASEFIRWMELFQAHADELRKFGVLRLDVDSDWYIDMQRQGRLFLFGVRDGEGNLIGYSSYYTHRHPHYRKVWCGQDDAIYVIPDLRGLGVASKLRELNLLAMKEEGIKFVTARTKIDHEHENHLLDLGFVKWEICWAKELK
jgi:GNAT superfamily N-acetyltransferase